MEEFTPVRNCIIQEKPHTKHFKFTFTTRYLCIIGYIKSPAVRQYFFIPNEMHHRKHNLDLQSIIMAHPVW